MVLSLTITEGPDTGRSFQLPMNEPQLIGRSSEALPITDTTVSRRHAELTPDEGEWYLRDLESQNHTFLNGQQITERVRIGQGDEIRVGATVFRVGDVRGQVSRVVELLGDELLDSEVERRLPSNEDSLIMAEPNPSMAARDHLRVIYQLTALTSQETDRQALLNAVMDLVFNEFQPERGVVMMVPGTSIFGGPRGPRPGLDEENIPESGDIPLTGIDLEPAVIRYQNQPIDEDDERIQVSRTILQATIRDGEGILSSNAQADPRFQAGDSVARYNIRSAICSPIKFKDYTFGVIYIDSSIANYTFTAEQLALMNAIGAHAALALANAEQTARMIHTERLAAIGETIASLSHSIKNILQGLRGGADVVEMGLTKQDLKIAGGGWTILKRNLDRIVGLTLNMLTFSRQRHVDLQLTKVGPLLEDCQQLLEKTCEDRGVVLLMDVDPEIPPIALDTHLMHQALMNLVSNAVEAVPAKTGIVTARVTYTAAQTGGPLAGRPVLEIAVVDNGPGISEEKLGWIFEPFNTTKGIKGTGLGLAVTRRIVADHGGRIRVETKPGAGATFRLLLPADLDETTDPSETAQQRSRATGEFPAM